MCTSCQAWRSMAEQAWNEVFRVIDIEKSLCPSLPPEVQFYFQKMLEVLSNGNFTPSSVSQTIHQLSARCENALYGQEKENLRAARAKVLADAAFLMEKLGNSVVGPSLQYLQIMQQLGGTFRYLSMMNSVMQEWTDTLRDQQRSWDALWHRHRQKQEIINQMERDALTGTPFIKAYLS